MGISLNKSKDLIKETLIMIDYLKTKNKISSKLHDKLLEVYKSNDMNAALAKVNLFYSINWEEKDKIYALNFANVFNASHDFWQNRNKLLSIQNNSASFRDDSAPFSGGDCNTVCAWADAAGGIYGLLLGPVGSLIYAALFTTIAAQGPACK